MSFGSRRGSNLLPMRFATTLIDDDALLTAAQSRDADAFECLIAQHRPSLHVHCYRMLGSLHDADDALQESLIRAWRAIDRFEGRSSLHSWLYRITTNVCLDLIARRPKRVLPIDYCLSADPATVREVVLPDDIWIEPYPDGALATDVAYASPEARYEEREGVELAFIAALQHLPARQRAALILRDVLGMTAKEVAAVLDCSPASVNSALQRARGALKRRLPAQSQQATMRALGERGLEKIVERFVDAFVEGDLEAIVALLAEDVRFEMPPHPEWYEGRDAVSKCWLIPEARPTGLRYLPTRANGQLALGTYLWSSEARRHLPIALDVLTLRGVRIVEVVAFRTPAIFPAFGLPLQLTVA